MDYVLANQKGVLASGCCQVVPGNPLPGNQWGFEWEFNLNTRGRISPNEIHEEYCEIFSDHSRMRFDCPRGERIIKEIHNRYGKSVCIKGDITIPNGIELAFSTSTREEITSNVVELSGLVRGELSGFVPPEDIFFSENAGIHIHVDNSMFTNNSPSTDRIRTNFDRRNLVLAAIGGEKMKQSIINICGRYGGPHSSFPDRNQFVGYTRGLGQYPGLGCIRSRSYGLEFRFFDSTRYEEDILRYFQFCRCLVDWVNEKHNISMFGLDLDKFEGEFIEFSRNYPRVWKEMEI